MESQNRRQIAKKECQNRCQIEYQKKMPGENIRIDAREASNRIMRELNARKGCQQIYAIYFQMRCQNLRQTNVTVWMCGAFSRVGKPQNGGFQNLEYSPN